MTSVVWLDEYQPNDDGNHQPVDLAMDAREEDPADMDLSGMR